MRLFRQTNSIRKTLDARYAAESALDLRPDAPIANEFKEVNEDLDRLEQRLAKIRDRQTSLFETNTKPKRKGSVKQLDLRTLIELVDEDDVDEVQWMEPKR